MIDHPMFKYLASPIIINHIDPKVGRMKYQNMITNERNFAIKMMLQDFLSIMYRGKGEKGRIIIGPREFEGYLNWMFDIQHCTQEELNEEFEKTYPKDRICVIEKNLGVTSSSTYTQEKNLIDRAKKVQQLMAKQSLTEEETRERNELMGMGYLNKEKDKEKEFDPFAAYGEATEEEKKKEGG